MESSSSLMMLRPRHRSLASTVELYADGGPGSCQIRADLSTPYDGTLVTNGALFTVTALESGLNIEALEFATSSSINNVGPKVQIWALKGSTFSNNPTDWIEITTTTTVASPDGLGVVVPHTEIPSSFPIGSGEVWSILVSFGTVQVLQMQETTLGVGAVYQEDDYLSVNVGQSIGPGEDPFSEVGTTSVAFQGRLHYRVLKPCESMVTTTKFPLPFAVKSGTDESKLKNSILTDFEKLLQEDTTLQRWADVYGLALDTADLGTPKASEDCEDYGFDTGCDLYTGNIAFVHYESLNTRELLLVLLLKLEFREGISTVFEDNGLNLNYTGSLALNEDYEISLMGLSSDTILNPIQRDYLAQIIYRLLDASSTVLPHRVDVSQTVRRRLRTRKLQQEQLNTIATISGIGDDATDFQKGIQDAFLKNKEQLLREIQLHQYLPGAINDETDLGAIFADVMDVMVRPQTVQEPTGSGGGGGGGESPGMSKDEIQIIIFTMGLVLSFLFLFYRFMKDFVLVKKGFEVETKKLAEKTESSDNTHPTTRPELENMDKPRQRPSTKFELGSLTGIIPPPSKNDDDRSQESGRSNRSLESSRSNRSTVEGSVRQRRHGAEGGARRMLRTPVDGDGAEKKSAEIDDDRSTRSNVEGSVRQRMGPATDGRGVRRAKSSHEDDDLSTRSNRSAFDGSGRGEVRVRSKAAEIDDEQSIRSNRSTPDGSLQPRGPPSDRGVRRVKSAVPASMAVRTPDGPPRRPGPPSERGVGRSKSAAADTTAARNEPARLSTVRENVSSHARSLDPTSKNTLTPKGGRPTPVKRFVAKSKSAPTGSKITKKAVGANGLSAATETVKKSKKLDPKTEKPVTKSKKKEKKNKKALSSEGSGSSGKKLQKVAKPPVKKKPSPNRVDMTGAVYL